MKRRIESAKGKSFNTLANMFCKAGLNYHRTGNTNELEVLKGVVPAFAELVRQQDQQIGTLGPCAPVSHDQVEIHEPALHRGLAVTDHFDRPVAERDRR